MRAIRYHEYNDKFRPIIRQISKAYMKNTNKDGTPLENAFKRRLHIYEVITSHTHNLVGHSPKRQTSLLREMNKCVRINTLRNSHKRVVRLWCPRNIAEQSSEDRPLVTCLLNATTDNISARLTKSTSPRVSITTNYYVCATHHEHIRENRF